MKKSLILCIGFFIIVNPSLALKLKWHITLQQPSPSDELTYSDDLLEIIFSFDKDKINFSLANKTNAPMKIIWDEVIFMDTEGQSMGMKHGDLTKISVNYGKDYDWTRPQSPSLIFPQSKFKDSIFPGERLSYLDADWLSQWSADDLFTPGDMIKNYKYKTFIGKSFGVFIPLEVEGDRKEYTFLFRIEALKKPKKIRK